MAGKTISAIGIKQILYGDELSTAPTYATLESAFTAIIQQIYRGFEEKKPKIRDSAIDSFVSQKSLVRSQ